MSSKQRIGTEISGRRRVSLASTKTPLKPPVPTVKPRSLIKTGWASYVVIVIGAVLVGLLSLDLVIGQWVVGVVGLVMLALKLDSRYDFGLALVTLGLVPAFMVLHRAGLAENYAVYSYYWLVFGVVSAMLELRRNKAG